MIILGINTALKSPLIGLVGNNINTTVELKNDQHRTENLIPSIAQLLENHDKSVTDLTDVVVITGPGSFTALRIGVITANSLAKNLKISLHALTTFEYMKMSSEVDAPIIVVHAGGQSVYDPFGVGVEGDEGAVIGFTDFLKKLKEKDLKKPIVVDLPKEMLGQLPTDANIIKATKSFADVCKQVVESQTFKVNSLPIEPNYVREPKIG